MAVSNIFSVIEMGTIPIVVDRVLTDQSITFAQRMPAWLENAAASLNDVDRSSLLSVMMILIPSLFLFKGLSVFGQRYLIALTSQGVAKDTQDKIYKKLC